MTETYNQSPCEFRYKIDSCSKVVDGDTKRFMGNMPRNRFLSGSQRQSNPIRTIVRSN